MVSQNLSGRIQAEDRRLRTENLLTLSVGHLSGRNPIFKGILDLKNEWTEEMKMQIRAEFQPGGGGKIPWRTGSMSGSFHRTLNNSPEGRIWLGCGNNKYAGFVDAMVPPINWTNKSSVYQWFQKAFRFMQGIIMPTLRRVIRKVGLAGMMQKSVSTITTAVEPV
jgi:hypothetical protein